MTMHDNRPIGVFDSGVGGLTVWRQIAAQLPTESTIYVADTHHCPYGPRGSAEIIALSTEITRFLLAQRCKLVVVACNTASAAALEPLRAAFDVPFVGLEPAIKPAASATQSGHIGVLATEGTFQGALFNHTAQTHAKHVTVHARVAHGLVSLVESGTLSGTEAELQVRHALQPMLDARVDQLVLGCTHYPFLIPLMQKITNGSMSIIDPAEAVARQVARLLTRHTLRAHPTHRADHRFYATGDTASMRQLLANLNRPDAPVASLRWQSGRLIGS